MSAFRAASRVSFPTAFLLGLAGCAALPNAGPSAATVKSSSRVKIVRITPSYASAAAAKVQAERKARVDRALARLADAPAAPVRIRFAPGDTLHVDLLTISPWSGGTSAVATDMSPRAMDLGEYTVGPSGTIDLPYAGRVRVAGLDVPEAQGALAHRFAGLGLLQNPAVKVDAGSVPQGSVVVTGAVGAPKTIPWPPAGMTLAEALTSALGNGASLLSPSRNGSPDRAATEVSIYRGDASPVRLPMSAALENVIHLEPSDRIVVTRAPAVRVSVLGAGVSKDGEYDYASPPTLAEVLAQAAGLDAGTANDHAVFVLRPAVHGNKPTVYNFAWNKVDGLVASQEFPIKNGDVVYVAAAPIVPIQRAISILFQLALPAQVLK